MKQVDQNFEKPRFAGLTLEKLNTLTEIQLGGHRKSDGKHVFIPSAEFRHLSALPALRKAVLWEIDGLDDEALAHIGKVTTLRDLDLGDAQITSAGLKHLRGLQSLTFLGIGWTKDITDAGMPDITAISNLETLVLSGTISDRQRPENAGEAAPAEGASARRHASNHGCGLVESQVLPATRNDRRKQEDRRHTCGHSGLQKTTARLSDRDGVNSCRTRPAVKTTRGRSEVLPSRTTFSIETMAGQALRRSESVFAFERIERSGYWTSAWHCSSCARSSARSIKFHDALCIGVRRLVVCRRIISGERTVAG